MIAIGRPRFGRAGRTGRDVLLRIGARGLGSALQAGSLVIVAREAGPGSFGTFSIAIAAGYLVSALTGMGASTRILRVAAEPDGASLGDVLLAIRLMGSAITLAFGFVLIPFGVPFWAALAAAVWVASDQLLDYAQAYFAGHGRQTISSSIVVGQRLVPFVGLAVLALCGQFNYAWLAGFALFVAVAGVTPLVAGASRPRHVARILRQSAGYWVAGLVSNLTQLEPIVLRLVAPSSVVGLYAIAARLTNPLTILISALQTVLVPELSKQLGRTRFWTVYRWFLGISALYALLLSLASPLIASFAIWILGEEYAPARALIVSMVIASGFSALAQAFQARLIAEGRPFVTAWVVGAGVVVGLAFMLVFVGSVGSRYLWVYPLVSHGLVALGMGAVATFSRRRGIKANVVSVTPID